MSELRDFRFSLDTRIKDSDNVFIIGHNSPDFDAIGSAMGLYGLAEELGKKAYIIVDDEPSTLEPGVKRIIDDNKKEYRFLKKKDALKLIEDKSLLIVTDCNKESMISVGEELDLFDKVVVIDHHSIGFDTINSCDEYISQDASSASEIVTGLLRFHFFNFDPKIANYLLAGISLDTHRFKQNTTSHTHDIAEYLIDNGADIDYVNNLFLEEFESFCKISNLIVNGTIIKKYSESQLSPIQVSFTLNRNLPTAIYLKEDCAKAADKMMKFSGIDAAFALCFVEDGIIHISGRSGKRVNVGTIMEDMGGGGTSHSGACRIEDNDIFKVEKKLMSIVPKGISADETIVDEPQVIKVKQVKRIRK